MTAYLVLMKTTSLGKLFAKSQAVRFTGDKKGAQEEHECEKEKCLEFLWRKWSN